MARALLITDAATTRVVLPASMLVGRHWRCDARVVGASVPLHWLELRWTGDAWAWRTLGAADRTVGRGRTLPGGWRGLEVDSRVRLGDTGVSLVLVDDAPPGLTLQHVETSKWVDGDARFDVVALTEEGPRLRGTDGEPTGELLPDGALVSLDGQQWRLHRPDPVVFTVDGSVSLAAPDLAIDFDLPALRAVFSSRKGEVILRGGLVRPLAVYAAAVEHGGAPVEGGWLSNVDAQAGLSQLGVDMVAGPERMNWDRHRLRSALTELGVTSLHCIFERKRVGRRWLHRLGIQPRISGLTPGLWPAPGAEG